MIHGAADVPVLPARVVHFRQCIQFRPDGLLGPPFFGKSQVSRHVGGDHLGRQLGDGLVHLFLHRGAYTGEAEEVTIQRPVGVGVELDDGADQTAAAEFPYRAPGPAEEEQEEDDLADSVNGYCISMRSMVSQGERDEQINAQHLQRVRPDRSLGAGLVADIVEALPQAHGHARSPWHLLTFTDVLL